MRKKKNKENEENLPIKHKKEKKGIFRKFADTFKSRWLQSGIATILLVAIIFMVYFDVNLLLENVVLPEIDLTKEKVYSLSEETKAKMKNLSKEVKITLINYDSNTSFVKSIEKYTTLNDLITLEKIEDLASRTDIMQKYSLETTDNLIVIESGEKERQITADELYTYDYSTYETVDLTEEAITNAIIDITTENKPVLYFMTNHIMYNKNYFESVLSDLEGDANEIKTIDLLAEGKVPEDCDTLIITTLKEDITQAEKEQIIEYINRGGDLFLMCGANLTDVALINFQEVLDQYAITIGPGVIFEGTSSNMLSGYPDFIVEEVIPNEVTKNINMTLNVCFADAAPITIDTDKLEELGVVYGPLITTTEKAFVRTDLAQQSKSKTDKDSEEGTQTIGVYAKKTINDDTTSEIIVYTNELFATDMSIQLMGYTYQLADLYNNKDIVLNSVAYLNEREDIITIRKNYDLSTYTVTQLQNNVIMAIIFITPVVIIVIGLIVWQVRRRRK